MRAFAEEHRFTAQTFVAVGADGLDPCDLRIRHGDGAVRQMIETKKPLFEFVLRRILAGHDLDTVEGRTAALRAAAPVVAGIRDSGLVSGYVRELARWLAVDLADVRRAVSAVGRRSATPPARTNAEGGREGQPAPAVRPASLRGMPQDPVTRLERDTLMMIVQLPHLVGADLIHRAVGVAFSVPAFAAVRDAIAAQLGALGGAGWLDRLTAELPPTVAPLLEELALAPIPARSKDADDAAPARLAKEVVAALVDRDLLRQKAELVRQLQRMEAAADQEHRRALRIRLVDVEADRRMLRGA
jgi:DNA primase